MENSIYPGRLILKNKNSNYHLHKNIIMKHLKLFFAILLPCYLVCSCGGDSAASSNSSQSSGDSTYTGNSSLSYTVEGRHIAIKDFMHDGDGKNWIALFINEVANKPG